MVRTRQPAFPYESLNAFEDLMKSHRVEDMAGGDEEAPGSSTSTDGDGEPGSGAKAKTQSEGATTDSNLLPIVAAGVACACLGLARNGAVAGVAGVLPIIAAGALVAGVGVACVVAAQSSKTRDGWHAQSNDYSRAAQGNDFADDFASHSERDDRIVHGDEHAAFQSAETKDCAQVSDYSSIAHGNVVAFHSEHHNRCISIWGSEEFLVVQVDESTFAFCSVSHRQYLCMNTDRDMTGKDYWLVQEDDASFDASFDEHEFIVHDEGNAKISLLSVSQDSYVRMDAEGNIDGKYTTSRESELFNVVLRMEALRRTH